MGGLCCGVGLAPGMGGGSVTWHACFLLSEEWAFLGLEKRISLGRALGGPIVHV